ELARLIEGLDAAGADRIYLDVVLHRSSRAQADRTLAEAIAESGRTFMVARFITTHVGSKMTSTLPSVAGAAPQVVAREWVEPFGYVWFFEQGLYGEEGYRQSLAAALAGLEGRGTDRFRIDYSIDYNTVPSFSFDEVSEAFKRGTASQIFAGKQVIIGNGGAGPTSVASIPGNPRAPASMVAILAAETLLVGPPADYGWAATLPAFIVLFLSLTWPTRT